ncbi:hypothetical protein G7Y89_g9732 [Cudoniella acicularis]|uniref:Glycoside hydrolase family 93 protein n=1 Tax=Cudoniella acicularis TaxID=354080 RepID=A0A8H4RGE4_9HELO|nr:hypothetical protein G7Y89_g9732 [Cudoniella acicularis]
MILNIPIAASPVKIEENLGSFSPVPRSPLEKRDFTDAVVFTPPSDYTSWQTIYGRSAQLTDGSLLVTWEDYPPVTETPFPIYRSTNGGETVFHLFFCPFPLTPPLITQEEISSSYLYSRSSSKGSNVNLLKWAAYSQILDQVNGWGMRYQPNLYVLPEAFGGYAAGTVLCVGVSAPANLSEAYIDVYASTDGGLGWKFLSHIAYGAGPEIITDGDAAIWEPFFFLYDSELICFYSDQRDSAHAQKLSYQTTTNLLTWSTAVDAVADPTYEHRPGMATVSYLSSISLYFISYELCISGSGCNAYYRWSSSPLTFNAVSSTATELVASGAAAGGSPYHVYYDGKIYMNGGDNANLFVNVAGETNWTQINVNQNQAYTRCLEIITVDGEDKLMLTSGGKMTTSGNVVTVGVITPP